MSLSNNFKAFKISFFVLALTLCANVASAQVDQTAKLNVTIKDVITFVLNDVSPSLVFDESSDFENGVSTSNDKAAVVTASLPFSVTVTASADDLEDVAGNKIAVKSISVKPTGSGIGTATEISLSSTAQTIISAAPAAIQQSFGLTYSTAANDAEFIGKPAGDYTVTLTYTASLD